MKLRSFLADRLLLIVFFLFSIGAAVSVIQLDLLHQHFSLSQDNLFYIGLFTAAILAAGLAVDYLRQCGFYYQVIGLRAKHGQVTMEDVFQLPIGITREQQFFVQLFKEQYGSCIGRIEEYRSRQEHQQYFVQQWVHHMKTPVSMIHLLTQQEARPEPEIMAGIQEETEKLAQGLEMMLHTARLAKFEVDVRLQKIDLIPFMRNFINEYKKTYIRSGIFPKLAASHEVCYIETDENWLGVIVNQIMSNAIKYSKGKPGGSKTLHIMLTKDGNGCHAAFQDEGIGIAEQDLPRVFDPFFTGENGRLASESTGIGLFLAKEVCARLGHRIEIESELGRGTTVRLHFPGAGVLHEGLARPK